MNLSEMRFLSLMLLCQWFIVVNSIIASEPSAGPQQVATDSRLVPQNLLKLIHAQEVQMELGLTQDVYVRFLPKLAELDRVWWPSRNLPEAEQRKVVASLEAKLMVLLAKFNDGKAVKRLREIELQSQGTRMLARADIAKTLGLTADQSKKLEETFTATDSELAKLAEAQRSGNTDMQSEFTKARESELKSVMEILSASQMSKFPSLVGKTFDTAKLERIYPLAPELIDSNQWAVKGPVKLSSLRGQVVLVHFYAFQCHNCVANFNIYNRWHKTLSEKGIRVVGIQTPETSAERDTQKVRQAAKEKGFEFPVLIDLENKNWDAWANTMWPTVYVIDKQGYIRHWWQGELNWNGATADKTIEQLVDRLLAEKA